MFSNVCSVSRQICIRIIVASHLLSRLSPAGFSREPLLGFFHTGDQMLLSRLSSCSSHAHSFGCLSLLQQLLSVLVASFDRRGLRNAFLRACLRCLIYHFPRSFWQVGQSQVCRKHLSIHIRTCTHTYARVMLLLLQLLYALGTLVLG
jgi:hypothetical protein